ncbi:MAG TPA: glycosyltransferase [Planctomycetota bacterium]|nr:glycosyltransferase [Planctomycetota bacterium]
MIVVPVRFHRVSNAAIAAESAFCEHLRVLRDKLAPPFSRLTVASPSMPREYYESNREHLGHIDEELDGIRWVALQPGDAGRIAFWLRHFVFVLGRLAREVQRAHLVHAGTSHDVYRPIEVTALLLAGLFGRKTICVVDIDQRQEAAMRHRTGQLGRKSLLLCRYVYDPLRNLQLRGAARWCSLVLLKGRRLCRDYGHDRPHVKYILESAYSAEHVIPPQQLTAKLAALEEPSGPLELVYFGRLAAYKGVDRCIAALALASSQCAAPMRLTVIGAGEELQRLQELCARLGVQHLVSFQGALPFGPQLFTALHPRHLLLAAPLSEDTPRSALDALASGIPILAFDTEYYSSLAESGAVDLVPWPSVDRLAERIAYYAGDKRRLIPLMRASVEFARANTQESWLDWRARWTRALFDPVSEPAPLESASRA